MPIASIRRIAVAASVAALLAVPTTVAAAPAASAAPAQPYPPSGNLFVNTVTFAGGPLAYVGTGFDPRERVTVRLDALTLDVDRAGGGIVAGRVTVPRTTTAGPHVFSLTGQTSGQYLSATVNVRRLPGRRTAEATVNLDAAPMANRATPAEKTPANPTSTGSQSAVGVAAALGALGAGTYFVLRRRRTETRRG